MDSKDKVRFLYMVFFSGLLMATAGVALGVAYSSWGLIFVLGFASCVFFMWAGVIYDGLQNESSKMESDEED